MNLFLAEENNYILSLFNAGIKRLKEKKSFFAKWPFLMKSLH